MSILTNPRKAGIDATGVSDAGFWQGGPIGPVVSALAHRQPMGSAQRHGMPTFVKSNRSSGAELLE